MSTTSKSTTPSVIVDEIVYTTHFMAIHGRHSFIYYIALLSFYFWMIVLFPIAHLCNRSYLLYHPDRPLPVPIAPKRNNTIHSFYPNAETHNYLTWRYPRLNLPRTWKTAEDMTEDVEPKLGKISLIILKGPLRGPLLQQGMVIYQGGQPFFIEQEFGRLPHRADLISTYTFALNQDVGFYLHIPVRHIEIHGLTSEKPLLPFQDDVPLHQLMRVHGRPAPRSHPK